MTMNRKSNVKNMRVCFYSRINDITKIFSFYVGDGPEHHNCVVMAIFCLGKRSISISIWGNRWRYLVIKSTISFDAI